MSDEGTYTSFAGTRQIVTAGLEPMLRATKAHIDAHGAAGVLIFEDQTGRQVDFDFRGTADEVVARVVKVARREGPGRPKLGVISREVSLLPRHWEWLERQPQSISATLRRLIDEARKREPDRQRARMARDAASRFMWAMAGNLPGFEEASRSLFARDRARFLELSREWPRDVRAHLTRIAEPSFSLDRAPGGEEPGSRS
jgi:hypothetical protein